jgi:hypothetical protein
MDSLTKFEKRKLAVAEVEDICENLSEFLEKVELE